MRKKESDWQFRNVKSVEPRQIRRASVVSRIDRGSQTKGEENQKECLQVDKVYTG